MPYKCLTTTNDNNDSDVNCEIDDSPSSERKSNFYLFGNNNGYERIHEGELDFTLTVVKRNLVVYLSAYLEGLPEKENIMRTFNEKELLRCMSSDRMKTMIRQFSVFII